MPQLGVSADTVINAILSCSLAFITLQGDTFFIVLGQQRHILITVYVTNHIAFYMMLSFLFHQFPRKLGQWPSLFKNLSAQESSQNPLARSAFFVCSDRVQVSKLSTLSRGPFFSYCTLTLSVLSHDPTMSFSASCKHTKWRTHQGEGQCRIQGARTGDALPQICLVTENKSDCSGTARTQEIFFWCQHDRWDRTNL